MPFISPALVARIYHALGQDRGAEAVLLLRQTTSAQHIEDGELMCEVVRLADANAGAQQWERAEEHYQLGLALYESCFAACHAEALRCVSALVFLAEKRNDCCRVLSLLQRAQAIAENLRQEYQKPKAVAV
jgi:hypothetical protein